MKPDVKICGLKTAASLEAALASGADYVGFVFFAPSPRNVEIAQARELARLARGKAKIVALFVDPHDALVREVMAQVAPDMIQLHGSETPERVAAVRAVADRPVMKAIKVGSAADAETALSFAGAADLILFDAKPPADAALPGGNGVAFDWTALAGIKDRVAYMLSGGLTPDNVAEAIRLTGAPAVDVSSGVESRPGEKDAHLIRRFLQAAKTANEAV
jgi:phosphoribosylanthranilate isomerase